MTRHFRALVCGIAGIALIGVFPASAVQLTPGTWQETESGTENGKPVPATTDVSCMTPEEAKDPLKGLSPEKDLKEMKGQCKTLDVKQSANSLSMRLQCGDPKHRHEHQRGLHVRRRTQLFRNGEIRRDHDGEDDNHRQEGRGQVDGCGLQEEIRRNGERENANAARELSSGPRIRSASGGYRQNSANSRIIGSGTPISQSSAPLPNVMCILRRFGPRLAK